MGEEPRVKVQTSLVVVCDQKRAPGGLSPPPARPLSYFSPHPPTALAILLPKTTKISRYHPALSTLSLRLHSEPTCPKSSHLGSPGHLSLGCSSFSCFLQTDPGIRNCGVLWTDRPRVTAASTGWAPAASALRTPRPWQSETSKVFADWCMCFCLWKMGLHPKQTWSHSYLYLLPAHPLYDSARLDDANQDSI